MKNSHLLLSIAIVVPTAIIYGSPAILPDHLDIEVQSVDLANMLRAIMCLYLGICGVWIAGVWKSRYWKIATQLNILFMLTLATGRLLSIIIDGIPTGGYVFGIIAEGFIGLFSIYQFRKYVVQSSIF
ncbi:DUF4345 domain-containing protein [Nonlabens antarcticus]|uniref:DUF4345 domain-containing protein n=1 Tax=Nonlabens antarcticus TaxID=392714 RepID=UPI00189197DA|nr:DUF4345 domain-containing protein [Nonlabens antarcticus]